MYPLTQFCSMQVINICLPEFLEYSSSHVTFINIYLTRVEGPYGLEIAVNRVEELCPGQGRRMHFCPCHDKPVTDLNDYNGAKEGIRDCRPAL